MAALLHDWLTEQAARAPERIAVVLDRQRLTYGELEELSNQLAQAIRAAGLRRGDRVCLLMPKCPLAIACIAGIYKAGCIYVPLDPASPAPRLLKILASCGCRLMLVSEDVRQRLTELAGSMPRDIRIGWMSDSESMRADGFTVAFDYQDVRRLPTHAPVHRNSESDPAHILFTSGSTGIPKGVLITHANVSAFITWAIKYFGISDKDRLSFHPPLHFDLSTFDIFAALATGAELHIVPQQYGILPNKLAEWIRGSGLTQWFSVPSVLNYLAKFGVIKQGDFPALKRVMWCGEVLPTPSLIHWMKRVPHASYTNLYGPTETTIASSYYTVPRCPKDHQQQIPIGKACGGETLFVLNDSLVPVTNAEVGDLYIGGAGVSPGYWENEAETTKAFSTITNSTGEKVRVYKTGDLARIESDNLVYFVGRKDYQIKSRGYRIELGEIETVLHAVEALREAAVFAVESKDFDGTTICCAFVPREGIKVSTMYLRERLRAELPEYMVPSQWRKFSELPKNPAGKIDRRRLADTWQESPASAA